MNQTSQPGLGELLRHATALIDRGAEEIYSEKGLRYRPRYTPLMRVLSGGQCTIGEITACARITQGAVSQTVKLMEEDGLVARQPGKDARQTSVSLTTKGRRLFEQLTAHWQTTFRAIENLETEVGVPLREVLTQAIEALEKTGFAERMREVEAESLPKVAGHDG